MGRSEVVEKIAELIVGVKCEHPVRVAVDGIAAAGKTVLADELSELIPKHSRPVIRASIDGFHNPQQIRYESGKDSAQGYYYDSFDYEAVKSSLLIPLGPDGNCQYVAAKFDFRSDCRVKPPVCVAERDSILLFDGIFLLRPELYDYWDFSIFVDIDYDVSIRRASVRDQGLFGTPEALQQRYHQRYVPGQQIYMESVCPFDKADVIVRNNDFDNPTIEICG